MARPALRLPCNCAALRIGFFRYTLGGSWLLVRFREDVLAASGGEIGDEDSDHRRGWDSREVSPER